MANPTAVSTVLTNQVASTFDVLKPEKKAKAFERYGDQGQSWFILLENLGFKEATGNMVYSHWEDNRWHDTLTVLNPVVAPGAGNDISFTLDPNSLDSLNLFYARGWDIILFKNETSGAIVNINTAVPTAPVITVRPHKTTFAFPALAADEELIITSSAFAEGTGQPTGAIAGWTEFSNRTQIIKETFEYTGTAAVDQTWLTLRGIPGAPMWHEGQIQSEYRYALKVDGMLLFGNQTDNPNLVDPANGRVPYTSEGLVPAIRSRGNEINYTVGSWSPYYLDEIDRILDREGAGKLVMFLMGLPLYQSNNDVIASSLANTNIQMATQMAEGSVFNGDKALQVVMNFEYYQRSNRVFMFKRLGTFTNPKLYGAPGYPMPNYGIVLPIAKIKDPKQGKMLDNLGFRHRAFGKYSRMLEVWQIGGVGNNEQLRVTDVDQNNLYWRGDIGAHQMGVNQMIMVNP